MRTEYQYIGFMCLGDTGKTTRWSIHNRHTNGFLGEIKWFSAWRTYCFYPISDIIFNDGCLKDIINFIEQLCAARKSGAVDNGLTTAAIRKPETPPASA